MAAPRTIIYNATAASKFLAYVPPHGYTLATLTAVEFDGDIWAMVSKNARDLASLVASVNAGDLEVTILYNTWRDVTAKATSYTVINDKDNYRVFTTLGATGAITFTLPTTIKAGQRWRFMNEVNQNMAITAPANKLVADGSLTSTTATFSTSSHKIGSCCEVFPNSDLTKYMFVNLGGTTATLS